MALVGGGIGGASNTVNPSGTGTSLNYIGNFVYGYAGPVATGGTGSADVTALKFATGAEIIKCTVAFCDDGGGSADKLMKIELDNQAVWDARYTDNSTLASEQPLPFIIPPHSRVTIFVGSATTDNISLMLVGELYA